jgi:hydrogenase/urease accessory protein HupE
VVADRRRRASGTRRALDWRWARAYLTILLALAFGIGGGVELWKRDAVWQFVLGAVLFTLSVAASVWLVRWLARPVDKARERDGRPQL